MSIFRKPILEKLKYTLLFKTYRVLNVRKDFVLSFILFNSQMFKNHEKESFDKWQKLKFQSSIYPHSGALPKCN